MQNLEKAKKLLEKYVIINKESGEPATFEEIIKLLNGKKEKNNTARDI